MGSGAQERAGVTRVGGILALEAGDLRHIRHTARLLHPARRLS
jgi:hypothetical protein